MGKRTQTTINNFIKKHGKQKFKWFLNAIANGVSGQVIADEFGVSRERVRQWKDTFGDTVMVYQLKPEVKNALGLRNTTRSIKSTKSSSKSTSSQKKKGDGGFWGRFGL
jgi:hypothetical protein